MIHAWRCGRPAVGCSRPGPPPMSASVDPSRGPLSASVEPSPGWPLSVSRPAPCGWPLPAAPTVDFAHSRFRLQSASHARLPTVNFPQSTSHSRLPTVGFSHGRFSRPALATSFSWWSRPPRLSFFDRAGFSRLGRMASGLSRRARTSGPGSNSQAHRGQGPYSLRSRLNMRADAPSRSGLVSPRRQAPSVEVGVTRAACSGTCNAYRSGESAPPPPIQPFRLALS